MSLSTHAFLIWKLEDLLVNRCGLDRQPGTADKAKYTLGRTSEGKAERWLWLKYVMNPGLYSSLIGGQREIERSA
jgi:hypothetical protein